MKTFNLENFTRGWFIGDFEPSIFKTSQFEVGLLFHKKGEDKSSHYHKIATEYNVLIKGKMEINSVIIEEGTIFIIEPGEIVKPIFYEDCSILCVKSPSIIGDKYIV